MKTTTFTPDSPHDPAHLAVIQASDEQKSDSHVSQLLAILKETSELLVSTETIGTTTTMDKAAVEAASSTYVAAALQLRNVVDDQPRWTVKQNAVDAKTEFVMDLKIKEHHTRIEMNQRLASPHAVCRTQLRQMTVGDGEQTWVCWLGGMEPMKNDVHGFGPSPAIACANFDLAFNREVQKQQQAVTQGSPVPKKRAPRKPQK